MMSEALGREFHASLRGCEVAGDGLAAGDLAERLVGGFSRWLADVAPFFEPQPGLPNEHGSERNNGDEDGDELDVDFHECRRNRGVEVVVCDYGTSCRSVKDRFTA